VLFDGVVSNIKSKCQEFVDVTGALPIYKSFTRTELGFSLKARQRNVDPDIAHLFSSTTKIPKILEKSIVCRTSPVKNGYYVFLPDGFEFLYNKNGAKYSDILDTFKVLSSQSIGDEQKVEVFLSETFCNEDLDFILEKPENDIIFHGCKRFYMVSASAFPNYDQLLEEIYGS
jgi:hypothetical protein